MVTPSVRDMVTVTYGVRDMVTHGVRDMVTHGFREMVTLRRLGPTFALKAKQFFTIHLKSSLYFST